MKKTDLMVLVGVVCAALAFAPSTAQAECTEKCAYALDEEGGVVGFACAHGSEGYNCVARIDECSITINNCGGSEMLVELRPV